MVTLSVVCNAVALAILSFATLLTFLNLAAFKSIKTDGAPNILPRVSVLIPARNEETNIKACLQSFLTQSYPNYEIVILNDGSSDSTRSIIDRLLLKERPRLRVTLLEGSQLPEGWVGKNWACQQLADFATGDYLFFTDADTIHAPDTVMAAVAFATKMKADLVSAWPRYVTRTLGERLVIPVVVTFGFVFGFHWFIDWLQSHLLVARRLGPRFTRIFGGANGQFMFFARQSYIALGGHSVVKSHVVEDIALGREVASRIGQGMRLYNCDSIQFTSVRMYRSLSETWSGFSKNTRPLFDRQETLFWLYVTATVVCFLAPCFSWLWTTGAIRSIVILELLLVALMRIVITARLRLNWLGALLHPLAIVSYVGIALTSWWQSRGAGVVWKGRRYHPNV